MSWQGVNFYRPFVLHNNGPYFIPNIVFLIFLKGKSEYQMPARGNNKDSTNQNYKFLYIIQTKKLLI